MTEKEKTMKFLRFGGGIVSREGRCVETTGPMAVCRLYVDWETASPRYLGDADVESAVDFLFGEPLWLADYIPQEDAFRIFAPEAPEDTIVYLDDLSVAQREAHDNHRELIVVI